MSFSRKRRYVERLRRKTAEKTWYFAFYKSGRGRLPGWMEYCLRGNYTHVLAFAQVDNAVVVLDPIQSHLDVTLRMHPQGCHLSMPVEFIALDFALHGGDVVKITYPVDGAPSSHALPNFFPGCVTMAKGLLGISDWVFTPWQFYNWLMENGGEALTKEKQDALLEKLTGRHLTPDEKQNIFRHMKRSA